jgi:hypothetical protein
LVTIGKLNNHMILASFYFQVARSNAFLIQFLVGVPKSICFLQIFGDPVFSSLSLVTSTTWRHHIKTTHGHSQQNQRYPYPCGC